MNQIGELIYWVSIHIDLPQDILEQGYSGPSSLRESYKSGFEDLAVIEVEEFVKTWKDEHHSLEEFEQKITYHLKVLVQIGHFLSAKSLLHVHSSSALSSS